MCLKIGIKAKKEKKKKKKSLKWHNLEKVFEQEKCSYKF